MKNNKKHNVQANAMLDRIEKVMEHNLRVPSYENNKEKEFPATKTYKYRNLPISASKEEWCIEGVDTSNNSSGVLEWCYDQLDATERLEIMSKYSQFKYLSIGCLKPTKEKPQVDFQMLKTTVSKIADCNWHELDSYESINLSLFFECMKNPSFAHKVSKWLQKNS